MPPNRRKPTDPPAATDRPSGTGDTAEDQGKGVPEESLNPPAPEETATEPDWAGPLNAINEQHQRHRAVTDERLEAVAAAVERVGRGLVTRARAEADSMDRLDEQVERFKAAVDIVQATSAPVPAIYGAMAAVMNDVQGVPKNGQMDPDARMGNYRFRKYDDLKRELGAAFRVHGVGLQSRIVNVTNEHPFKDDRKTRVQVQVEYRFTSLEDGSVMVFESLGESVDTSDKASGKAMTMALKTALDQAFMLAADDIPDPDAARPGEDDDPAPEQRRATRDVATQRRPAEVDPWDTGAPPEQPAPAQPQPDGRTPEEAAQAAADAASADDVTLDRWSKINAHAQKMGLMEVLVRTPYEQQMPLKHYLLAVGRTLT